MTLFSLIVIMMTALAPRGLDIEPLATVAARVVSEMRPLFQDDEARIKTAALIVAVMWRESKFDNDARSRTNDHCAMQINGRPSLARDPEQCIRTGVEMLRVSFRVCPAYPLAFYAEGPKGCESERGRRISKDRMNLAAWLADKAKAP